jgi:Holliday junction resolvase RusA-like endonuclease
MAVLAFSMSGEPRGKGRPRVDTRGAFPRMHTDGKTARYERSVQKVAMAHMVGRTPFAGPVSVSLRFRLPIPKSLPKVTRAAMAAGEIAPAKKPDLDNMAKAILDAMNKVVFLDDAQVVRSFQTKVYAEQPGVDVRVEAFAPQGAEA